MMPRKKRNWYDYGDERFQELRVKITKVFSNAMRTCNFDEINASRAQTIATEVYTKLVRMNRKYFRDLWWECYYEELEDLYDGSYAFNYDIPQDAEKPGKIARKKLPERWSQEKLNGRINRVLSRYDPTTRYVYEQEIERKRSRFFESIVADGESKNRLEFEKDFKRAEKLWLGQTRQYFINVEDDARTGAIRDTAETADPRVMWITMEDEKVCGECEPLHGLVFNLSRVPPKHYNCRCRLIPWH